MGAGGKVEVEVEVDDDDDDDDGAGGCCFVDDVDADSAPSPLVDRRLKIPAHGRREFDLPVLA